ncbi:uncharacterized protein [Macrobrachium rosenbergii]|uniref:uncharacterized protein n=1 Tax=Macrobrachium rosenbergii TaxID=79674 RepID=UPI0034D45564
MHEWLGQALQLARLENNSNSLHLIDRVVEAMSEMLCVGSLHAEVTQATSSRFLMTDKFVWHGINKDIQQWARSCIPCQVSKTSRHTESGVSDFPQPRRQFSHIYIDVVEPHPKSGGARYLLLIIDHSTYWPKATPMEEASTASCTETLLSSWISCFGVPDSITIDMGPAFRSELWVSLARLMGTTLHSTTAYNPAVNGMVERAHRSLKAVLVARCTDKRWKEQLPWVLLGLCTALKANGNASPAEKVYRETLAVPREFFPQSTNGTDTHLPRTTTYSPPTLDSCAYIFIRVDAHRPPLTRPYRGTHRVIRRATKAYLLDIHGREDLVTIDRLKPAFLFDSKVCEEAGRRPRVPPQYLPADTKAGSGATQGTHRANPRSTQMRTVAEEAIRSTVVENTYYIDGSVDPQMQATAAAVATQNFKGSWRLPNSGSILQAELMAIFKALEDSI